MIIRVRVLYHNYNTLLLIIKGLNLKFANYADQYPHWRCNENIVCADRTRPFPSYIATG